jgi:hypothetical protein
LANTTTVMARPKKNRPPRRAVTYRLPEYLLAALETMADEHMRPVTSEIIEAVQMYLAKLKRLPEAPPPAERKGGR